jgi:hypothetical protein
MSLDGFVDGPGDETDEVFSWITAGTSRSSQRTTTRCQVDEASAEELRAPT